MPVQGMNELRDPGRLRAAMTVAGFADMSVIEVTNDFLVDKAGLADPERLFQFSPVWPMLNDWQRDTALASIDATLIDLAGVLPVSSPALIATARRA